MERERERERENLNNKLPTFKDQSESFFRSWQSSKLSYSGEHEELRQPEQKRDGAQCASIARGVPERSRWPQCGHTTCRLEGPTGSRPCCCAAARAEEFSNSFEWFEESSSANKCVEERPKSTLRVSPGVSWTAWLKHTPPS